MKVPPTPVLLATLSLAVATAAAAPPHDLLPLNPASPNYAKVFSGVKIGVTTPETNLFKAGDEILSAVCAYLCPTSPVYNNVAYRDRLFVLLDDRMAVWAGGTDLTDISYAWQSAYAYMLMKQHRPDEISAARRTIYEQGIANAVAEIIAKAPLLYSPPASAGGGVLAQVWLNGDIRLAKAAYFGGIALGDPANLARAERARAAIDGVMARCGLADGGTHYVGFWNEVASYHEETVRNYIYWWKITGSPSIKAALDATLRYSVVSNEPSGFTEQSSNIPYKHMYNNNRNLSASLWKAYLYDDGYNYFFGKERETATSTELLNAVLYQPARQTKIPPDNVGVFFDQNIQGPRYRSPNWGWVVNARDVQRGGPEEKTYSDPQGYQGMHCGRATFVGAFTLGPITNKTSLKGALDTFGVEFKETPGVDTDYNRGSRYRFLTQDENTRVITRRNFGTVSSTYRISRRTSSAATANWNAGATAWLGQQLWVLTGERMIGVAQIVNDADSRIYGLDARLVFTGGRQNIMGAFLPLTQPDPTSFAFGDIRAKIHATTFTGAITQQRFGISEAGSTDDYSALVRINDPASADDALIDCKAATPRRNWIVLDVTRAGTPAATSVYNVIPGNATWAVLQFTEGARKVRIVQNLTATARSYSGSFVVGSTYATTTLHRSWSNVVTPLAVANGTAVVTDTVPPYGHMIAVNSNQPEDHVGTSRTSADVYGANAYLNEMDAYALGGARPQFRHAASATAFEFPRLRSDVDYTVESSTDLTNWSTFVQNPGAVGQTASVFAPLAPPSPGRQFFRLRLTPQR